MSAALERLRRLLPALWLGLLLCVAGIATPAPFALLAQADAGRVVARVLASEAWSSLGLGFAVLLLERRAAQLRAAAGSGSVLSTEVLLALGTLGCTLAGYFGVQPLLVRARLGQTGLSFGQLHTVSLGLFALKTVLVGVLAWRATRR